ncbi:hypothetical protein BU23DRAFT_556160, partial [Bimuria novae-zelandiae CBS 107.79]
LVPLPPALRASCSLQLPLQTRCSLASGALRMHGAMSYPAWRLIQASLLSQEISDRRQPQLSTSSYSVLLVSELVHLFNILSIC